MSSSVLSQLALDAVVDGSSPDLTSLPHTRASKKPRGEPIPKTLDTITPISVVMGGMEWRE